MPTHQHDQVINKMHNHEGMEVIDVLVHYIITLNYVM